MKKFLCGLVMVVALAATMPAITTAQGDGKVYSPEARSTYSPNDVKAFVYQWFAGFDHQADAKAFTDHLDPQHVDMAYPDFPIASIADFQRWYQGVIDSIQWNSHDLSNLTVTGSEADGFQVSFDVRWQAKTYDRQSYDVVVHQDWTVAVTAERQFVITRHRAYIPETALPTEQSEMKRQTLRHHDLAMTPLHRAAGLGDVALMQELLTAGASVHEMDAAMGATPLHYAAQSGSAEAVTLLLQNGALPNVQVHSHGMTPLMVAVWHRNPAVVKVLLQTPAVDMAVRNRFGATAEDMIGGFLPGQDGNVQDAQMRDLFAAANAKAAAPSLIAVLENADLSPEQKTEQVRALLAAGADPNQEASASSPFNPGHSALLAAARDGHADIVRALLDAGADITRVGNVMLAHPGHKAGYMGHGDVMQVLVASPDFGKIINAQGPFNGYTALHDAAWHGHKDAVQALLDAGARTKLLTYAGQTAEEVARYNGHEDVADLIAKFAAAQSLL